MIEAMLSYCYGLSYSDCESLVDDSDEYCLDAAFYALAGKYDVALLKQEAAHEFKRRSYSYNIRPSNKGDNVNVKQLMYDIHQVYSLIPSSDRTLRDYIVNTLVQDEEILDSLDRADFDKIFTECGELAIDYIMKLRQTRMTRPYYCIHHHGKVYMTPLSSDDVDITVCPKCGYALQNSTWRNNTAKSR